MDRGTNMLMCTVTARQPVSIRLQPTNGVLVGSIRVSIGGSEQNNIIPSSCRKGGIRIRRKAAYLGTALLKLVHDVMANRMLT